MYVIVVVNGPVYGVFNNPEVAHAWAGDYLDGKWHTIFQVTYPPSLPEMFLVQGVDTTP